MQGSDRRVADVSELATGTGRARDPIAYRIYGAVTDFQRDTVLTE